MAKREERIDAQGAARWNIAGRQGDSGHKKGGTEESGGVGWTDAVKLAGEKTSDGEGGSQTESDTDQRKLRSFLHDEPENVAALRAEGYTDADFASPPGNEKRKHTVDADEAENEGEPGKSDKKHRCGSGSGYGIRE